ncbi:Ig-like domain-containing protein [Paenibacillus aceti]|uniref:SLH domain-containing protein n=1 Tax=Paenibacillus aceti TaxID=1820010 RepID=A0ABQ1VTF8_9BACL|nr:Ig-like domain-containing protein [Paenibacillus aceti]GGF96285.1 hypothetical protein GCM10010913_17360 [Paenibacillus aceti]
MSNKSYSFKENSYVIVNQGGEKKVMKKILSVALSTAMAFSMFATVAFGADAKLTPEQQFNALKDAGIVEGFPDGQSHLDRSLTRAELAKIITKATDLTPVEATSYNDKNYAKHWARTYIEAVTQAGIMEGKNAEKKLFDPSGNLSVQELAAVLVRALKLEVPADANNTASEWAKGFVEAAVKGGYIDAGINYQANASRSQAIVAAYAIYQDAQFKVTKAEAIDATHVKLTLSNGEVVDVTLEKALEANKATELEYTTKDGKVLKYTVTWVVTTATKVEKVSASNLKEAVVAFDGKVDKETAEDVANYSLKSGKAISKAVLSDDEKTVTLTLNGTLTNNKADFLTVSNIKAGDSVISAKEVEFYTVDNQLPEVSEVKSLGTKSVKIVFSEPVQLPAQSSFELDGKNYFGNVKQPTLRTVILTPYNTSALAVGDHKLVIGGVYDYAGFKSLNTTHEFTVVEDKDAPTITEASATLETVTITFSEEVDTDTVKAANVYWKSGSDKKKANTFEVIADNKIKFTFKDTESLPTGAIPVYVEGVKDYSGNEIAKDSSVIVNPEIDTTRPEVKKAVSDGNKTVKITFSKSLESKSAETKGNYTVTNKDNKVLPVKSAVLNGKVVTLELYSEMSVGGNTLTVKNVKDSTRLQNTMLDYSGSIDVADTKSPAIDYKLINQRDRTVIVGFSKKMDPATLADYSNYYVQVGDTLKPLTSAIADISIFNDSNAVAFKFSEEYAMGAQSSDAKRVSQLQILGVKDEAGNLLKEFTTNSPDYKISLAEDKGLELAVYDKEISNTHKAALVDKHTLEVKLSAGVTSGSKSAFEVTNTVTGAVYTVDNIEVNGTSKVKLNFGDKELNTTSAANLKVKVYFDQLTTLAGRVGATGETDVLDKVKPEFVGDNVAVNGNNLEAKFTEAIQLDPAANVTLLAKDFEITRYFDGKKLVAGIDYTVQVNPESVTIVLSDAGRKEDTSYTVKFLGSKYLTDTSIAKNEVASFEKETNGRVANNN